jgi:hypothetical protein
LTKDVGTTLCSDEASKLGKKVITMALTDSNGNNFALGLRDLKTKSSSDTLEVFRQMLDDVTTRLKETRSEAGKELLLAIRFTMSDRAATEKKFNELLQDLINEVLPTFRRVGHQLEAEDAAVAFPVKNFFCGLHIMGQMATTVSAASLVAEKGHFNGPGPIHNPTFRISGESDANRLVRTVCKAFARGADEKNGVFGKLDGFLKPILKEKFQARSLPLTPYRGSRFNVLFHNSSVLYCLHPYLLDFLTTNHNNGLTASVFHDLQQPYYVAMVRSFAILSKLYMKPMWAMLEDRDVDIVQMGKYYSSMVSSLETATENPELLLQGQSPFPEHYLRRDEWWEEVFKVSEDYDSMTLTSLGITVPTLASLLKHHLKDHLPGGIHEQLESSEVHGVPKHNKFCESLFAYWDHLLRFRPNISTLTAEAFTLFAMNKTGQWLQAMDEVERNKVIRQAQKDTKELKNKYKERQEEIRRHRRESLEKERQERERKQRERAVEISALCVKLEALGGLWDSDGDVGEGLKKLKLGERSDDKRKLDAIKVQLQYRRKVLQQKVTDAKLWCFSEGKLNFTVTQMTEKLKIVIRQPIS